MEITLDKKTTTEGLIKIKLTEGDYQPHVEEKVKDYARKANIKGFRQGKVPSGVIRKMFGKSILVDEINHLLSHKLSDYIKENNLKILGDPLPDQAKAMTIDWDAQKDFEFEYQIGLVEDFTYDLSKNVKVKAYRIEQDNKIIDETVADLKKRFGKVSNPEISESSDNLFGELRENGEVKREHAVIPVEKIEKQEQAKFVGLKKDDEVTFEIDKIFKDNTLVAQVLGVPEEEANNAKGLYTFKVNNISRTEPGELNQELFDRVFGKGVVNDEASFLDKIRETIGANYKREADHFLEHYIEDYFLDHTKINLPDGFLKTWLKSTSKGEVTDAVLDKEFSGYVRGLKWDLIKNKIADDNKVQVEPEEVKNKAKEMLIAQFGGDPSIVEQLGERLDAIADNYLSGENGQNFMKLYNQLKNEKIINFIKDKITIDEQGVNAEEFKKIVGEHKH